MEGLDLEEVPVEELDMIEEGSYEVELDDRGQSLNDFILARVQSGDKAAITMQYTPDPDSLASAFGLQWLLETQYGLNVEILAAGDVSHPQNQTMKNMLDIRLSDTPKHDPEDYALVIVVDSVPQNTGFQKVFPEFHAVFDHHHFDLDLPFTDIRSCGSCSSMVWEYLRDFNLDWNTEKGLQVATALIFGVRNDTSELLSENTSKLDIEAHADLILKMDRKKLSEIINFSFPSYLYDLRSKAVDTKVVKDSMLISSLGILTQKKRDALPIIADEFIRMEGVETVVVHAIVGDHIVASVRSRNSAINVHDFCQRIFGKDYAGGKPGSGGAKTPLGFLYSDSDDDNLKNEICNIASKILTQRILSYLSGG